MKITILGTGCIWTKRACASYLINDDVIVDPGSGTLKQLLKSSNKLLHHEKIERIEIDVDVMKSVLQEHIEFINLQTA